MKPKRVCIVTQELDIPCPPYSSIEIAHLRAGAIASASFCRIVSSSYSIELRLAVKRVCSFRADPFKRPMQVISIRHRPQAGFGTMVLVFDLRPLQTNHQNHIFLLADRLKFLVWIDVSTSYMSLKGGNQREETSMTQKTRFANVPICTELHVKFAR